MISVQSFEMLECNNDTIFQCDFLFYSMKIIIISIWIFYIFFYIKFKEAKSNIINQITIFSFIFIMNILVVELIIK